ncbi:hypothetical protein [Aquimarina longa]|uniref:hypothetical protein n=1 Tax=Aquimarina longa TaxID=1080221 RepID=UPI000785DAC2|nr:hypothetical protein [Aquimarina longa]
METYIQPLILLLLIVLLIDRFRPKKITKETIVKNKKSKKNSSIMGEPKTIEKSIKGASKKKALTKNTPKKNTSKVIPTEALDEVFGRPNTQTLIADDWEFIEEEEDLKSNISIEHDQDFSTGISVDELGKISTLLKQKELTNETLPVAVKIADTELLELLNEQIPQAQQRVTSLLDKYLKTHHNPKISEDWRDFDIGEFV